MDRISAQIALKEAVIIPCGRAWTYQRLFKL